MNAFTTLLMMFVALASILSSSELRAADTKTTTITVKGMHCGGCAKKVAAKLKAVPGVDNVNVDASTSQASLTPQGNKVPSPRACGKRSRRLAMRRSKLRVLPVFSSKNPSRNPTSLAEGQPV